MEITDVRIKLVNNSSDRLKAFCSVTLDEEFVIRDIKLVEGSSGLFVAMPSRKLSASCPECRHKNPLRAHYCNECGAELPRLELPVDDHGRLRLYRDIAHPITAEFREKMQALIVETYQSEEERSEEPDYKPASDIDLDDVVEAIDDNVGNRKDQPSEYAALIAGLDQGGRSDGHRPQPRKTDRKEGGKTQDARSGQRRTDRAATRRTDTRSGQKRNGGRGRTSRDERLDHGSKPQTAPAALVSAKDDRPEKPLFDKKDEPRRERTSPLSRDERDEVSLSGATKETDSAESPDDTSAFGAGIL